MSHFPETNNAAHFSGTDTGQRRGFSTAEKVGTALGVVGIAVALLTWLVPPIVDGPPGAGPVAVPATPVTTRAAEAAVSTATTGADAPPPNGQPTSLAAVVPVSGKANTTGVPRALQGQPGYERAVVIGCPTNETNDKHREVGYPLRGRYLDLRSTVRGYSSADPVSRVEVSTLAGTRQRDGTLVWRETGRAGASGDTTAPLAASVEGAEELRVQVRCDDPEGFLILLAPRLTPTTG